MTLKISKHLKRRNHRNFAEAILKGGDIAHYIPIRKTVGINVGSPRLITSCLTKGASS